MGVTEVINYYAIGGESLSLGFCQCTAG